MSLFFYTKYQPITSAKAWYKAVMQSDNETAISLTCNSKANEIEDIITHNSPLNIQESDFSDINFKTIDSGDNFAIIDVTGTISRFSWNIYQRWYFTVEDNQWKWCGLLERTEDPQNNLVSIIIAGAILLFIGLITQVSQKKETEPDFSQFISPIDENTVNDENLLAKLVNYETGEIKSFNNRTGEGVVETGNGEKYSIHQKSLIGKGQKKLNVGEDILFQRNWESKEKKAKNIIKVENDSSDLSPYSTWLIQLAHRTKRLRRNLRFSKLGYIQSELNTCKAFLEQLNDYAEKNNVKLEAHEVVLTNIIERELNSISKKAESSQDSTSWWSGVLRFVLQMLSILADFISIASPDVALLLKSVSKGVSRLLGGRKPPPSLGSGDE